jgi:hypothetical protein
MDKDIPSKSTRLQKLERISMKKRDKADTLESARETMRQTLENYQPGGLLERTLGSDNEEISRLRNFHTALTSTITLIKEIQNSQDPVGRAKEFGETLIQKENDPEWVGKERGDDLRLFLFTMYFNALIKGFYTPEDTLTKLHERRFDKSFYPDFISKLPEITTELEKHLRSTAEFAEYFEKGERRHQRNSKRNQSGIRKKIVRLDEQIPRAQASATKFEELYKKEKGESGE